MHRTQSSTERGIARPATSKFRAVFRTPGRSLVALAAAGLFFFTTLFAAPGSAVAQATDIRYAEEPTGGLEIPATSLTGEHDAYSVVKNPAGLMYVGGFSAGLGLNLGDDEDATATGPGLGLYLARSFSGGLIPPLGLGVAFEFLQPSRAALDPDPGSPTRISLAAAMPLGRRAALGLSYHRLFDDPGLATDAVSSLDVGMSLRIGSHWAFGAVIRDLNAPVAAGVPVQRRYELELLSRPLATDRLELAVGGRIGETRADIDGWARISARVARGLYLKGEFTTRELKVIETTPIGVDEYDDREYLATAGVEISLGSVGATFLASAGQSDSIERRLTNGVVYLRASSEQIPSLVAPPKRIERIELTGGVGERRLTGVLLYLRKIARDPDVVAVVLQIDGVAAGWASVQELRTEVMRVRQAGKKVFAYIVAANTRDYFLATAADKIYLDPAGGIRLTGFAGTSTYVKGTFDKLGVSAQFEKIEEYKSAPEQWTHEAPTEPAQRMRNALYDSLYAGVLDAISQSRGIDRETARGLIDRGPYTAGDLGTVKKPDDPATPSSSGAGSGSEGGAADSGKTGIKPGMTKDGRPRRFGDVLEANSPLVDAIAGPEKVAKLIIKELGAAYPVARAPRHRAERWSLPQIAVIYITGDIVSGKSRTIPFLGRRLVGGDTIVRAIAVARANPRVKAIVLRIDSPGGSALASEIMAREVFKTRGIKPIICSMGDVAASGGYFAAAGCDMIFADPMTITGSIGIFYGKFDLSGLLSRLGISWHTYKRGAGSDMESYFRPYTDEERKFVKERIRYFYTRFIDAVAQGRGMTREQVDAVGRGRVWSGTQAKEQGLVDELGGLSDALTVAKARIGLTDDDRVRLVILPQQRRSLASRLLGVPGLQAGDDVLGVDPAYVDVDAGDADIDAGAEAGQPSWISSLLGFADVAAAIPASLVAEPQSVQARMPFHIVWH